MKLNKKGLEGSIRYIKNCSSNINGAIRSLNSIKIPAGFSGNIKGVANDLQSVDKEILSIKTWIETQISRFDLTAKKNKSDVEQLLLFVNNTLHGEDRIVVENKYDKNGVQYEYTYRYKDGEKILISKGLTGYKKGEYNPYHIDYKTKDGKLFKYVYKYGKLVQSGPVDIEDLNQDTDVSFLQRLSGNALNAFAGFGKGAAKVGEGVYDTSLIYGQSQAETYLRNAAYDPFARMLYGDKTTEETKRHFEDISKESRKQTMSKVTKENVESWFKKFYNNGLGKTWDKWAGKNSIFRSNGAGTGFLENIGNVTTTGLLGALIPGANIVTMPIVAFASTMGNNTEQAWKTGAKYESGVIYGTATGLWEATQWGAGIALNTWKGFTNKKLTSITRVGVDTLFNTADTPYRALASTVVTGKTIKEAFENAGGKRATVINGLVGLLGSLAGEVWSNRGKINQQEVEYIMPDSISELRGLDLDGSSLSINRKLEISKQIHNYYLDGYRDKVDIDKAYQNIQIYSMEEWHSLEEVKKNPGVLRIQ